jgi:hypothetical protein
LCPKFGNLSSGRGAAESDTKAETGNDSGEGDDVFKLEGWEQSVMFACKKEL